MPKITITEALQEIKTINKRLERKRQAVLPYIVRDSKLLDPFAKDGGSLKFIESERQAINDLEKRIIAIRTAIQQANLKETLKVEEKTMTVAEWLTWRREVSQQQQLFLRTLAMSLAQTRDAIQKRGGKTVFAAAVATAEASSPSDPPQVIVNVDEKQLLEEQERLEKITGDLDGKLSLFNATQTIELVA